MKKKIFPMLMVMVLAGCFGLQTAKRYFQLQVRINPDRHSENINRVLYIDSVYSEDLYDDFRVVYRISPYQINYYSYDFWAKKPSILIKNSLVDYFIQSNIFSRVTDKLSDAEPELILKSKLFFIEEDDVGNKGYARLSMEFEIMDFKDKSTVYARHRFDEKKILPGKEVLLLPKLISEILQQELEHLIQKLVERFQSVN